MYFCRINFKINNKKLLEFYFDLTHRLQINFVIRQCYYFVLVLLAKTLPRFEEIIHSRFKMRVWKHYDRNLYTIAVASPEAKL